MGQDTKQAVLFPGQGAQFVGMSAQLVERIPATRELFDAGSRLVGADLYELCAQGPESKLNSTAISQPAIFVVSLAVLRAIAVGGGGARLAAAGTAGLSLGEYTALVFAGALDFQEALEIVVRRGAYMQEACDERPGGMTSVIGLDLAAMREVVAAAAEHGTVAIANVNAPAQIVLSGEAPALERAVAIARERGARRTVPLKVAGAYHSPLMAGATRTLAPYLERAKIRAPRIPFYPNVTARQESDPARIRRCLLEQIESPVLWGPTLEALLGAGVGAALEPGPGRVVAGLMKQVNADVPVTSLLSAESIELFLAAA